ncbi:MAG: RluA family pseudouridine synthase [Pseudomonadota bacterium]
MSGVQHITVTQDDEGQRLDRWLAKTLKGTPYSLLNKLMRKGQIRVDSKRVKADTRLVAGQSVRIPPIEDREQSKQVLTKQDKDFIRSLVIYDDGEIIALNKPSGLATQGGTNIKRHIDGMLEGLKNKENIKPRLVHRLDKDTSGVLLLARSANMARDLGKIFKGRDIQKIYWALVMPAPTMNKGEIQAPLRKAGAPLNEKMIVDPEEGQAATTLFDVIDRAHTKVAFMAFWPRTGRTHQIRVHAQSLGCPIIGDSKYNERQIEHAHEEMTIEDVQLAKRLHLHARSVSFEHPKTKKIITIESDLPQELQKSWQALGFDPRDKTKSFDDIDFRFGQKNKKTKS